MKIKISIVFVLFNLFAVFAQQDLIKEIGKQAIIIDSLMKVNKNEKENYRVQNEILKNKIDSIKILKLTLSKLEKFKAEKGKVDNLIKQKNDSITLLKNQKSELSQKISSERIICEQKKLDEKEKVKSEILAKIINTYKGKKFDDLIVSSSKFSIERDLQLIGENNELNQIFIDLNKYFDAKSLLDNPFDGEKLKKSQIELNTIKQPSASLDKLKIQIENYQLLDKGLRDCLINIDTIDKKETVSGMEDGIKKLKLNKIQTEISKYIFNYDFNFSDYPYLSGILFQVIKIKFPNPDQDISKLIPNK
ncbi:hypothetical protein [Flavobacterium gilvum]|uniref:Uncharacterized protein n=1 Tax=Flavobacterium gilvum TaxID=1492737 RepID=A0AAC9I6I4_9FLAO|nr:hypothetical protein [Flavobacterium gilvum]AOW11015.1 hypothetical protein EM308_16825 [Flavobacterium gilvum]KFC59190.1 hypothetical protein FEM08_20510 [Flavobacterium gilvum]